jgi:negative regulator of flagellin synthesis FlgM
MTIKIRGLDPRPSVGVVPSAGTRGKPVEGQNEDQSSGRPNVEVSASARRMADLESRVATSSGINEAKVEAIRLALERGEYQIDSKKIADQLMKLDWEIGKASGRV